MLHIDVPEPEQFNDSNQEFITEIAGTLVLEHSLISLSKWEQLFEKPFINTDRKTDEETLAYIRCMDLGSNTPPDLFKKLTPDNITAIQEYINAKMSATWFAEEPARPNREVITAELLYYYMISLGIPFECENWHLNRLLTLIQVCNRKNAPKKKMGRSEAAVKMAELNEQRRAQLGTNG